MSGWQAVASIALAIVGACALAMTGHEQTSLAIGGPIITGVFTLMVQRRRTHKRKVGNEQSKG